MNGGAIKDGQKVECSDRVVAPAIDCSSCPKHISVGLHDMLLSRFCIAVQIIIRLPSLIFSMLGADI